MKQSITLKRLENEISWFGRKSQYNQVWFTTLKFVEIVIAAAIPLLVVLHVPALVNALAGVGIVILEGMQNLFQFQDHWVAYRTTVENLKHEKYLFFARAGLYAEVLSPEKLLAERIEAIIAQEQSRWVGSQEKMRKLLRKSPK